MGKSFDNNDPFGLEAASRSKQGNSADPFGLEAASAAKKKAPSEPSQPEPEPNFGLLADPALKPTSATSRYNSPFISTSPAATETDNDEDVLPKIADLARRHDQQKGLPVSLQKPDDILAQQQRQGRYNKILQGDAEEITRTIKTERERIKEARNNPNRPTLYDPTGQGVASQAIANNFGVGLDLDKDIVELENSLKPLQQKAVKKIDDDAATKLLSFTGRQLQEKALEIGQDRRRKLADIGADVSFEDEKGAAAWALKNKVAYGFMPGKVSINGEKYKQEHDYLNERGVYDASLKKLEEQLGRMEQDTKVQLYLNGTAEQRDALKDDPTITDFLNRVNRYDYLANTANNLVNKYPAVKYEQEKNRIADAWANKLFSENLVADVTGGEGMRQLKTLFAGERIDTEEEYREISEATGIPIERVREHAKQDSVDGNVGTPSYLGRVLRAGVGVFNAAGQGVNRLTMDKDKANVINRELEGVNYQTPEKVLGKNWTANRIFDTMASGLGQFAGFVATAGVASAPLRAAGVVGRSLGIAERVGRAADLGGTVFSGYASSYEAAYQEAARATADEDKRNAFATGSAWANGLSELILPDLNVARGILGGVSKRGLITDYLKGAKNFSPADVMKARLGQFAETIGMESAEELIPYIVDAFNRDNILGQPTTASAFLQGGFDTIVQSMVATVPMAALSLGRVPTSGLQQAAIYEAAKNPEKYKALYDEQLARGEITAPQLNAHNKLINTVSDIVANLPQSINGKTLTERQKAQLTYNFLEQRNLNDKLKTAEGQLKPAIREQLEQSQAEAQVIIDSAGEAAPAPAVAEENTTGAIAEREEAAPAVAEEDFSDAASVFGFTPSVNTNDNATQNSITQSEEKNQTEGSTAEFLGAQPGEQKPAGIQETVTGPNNRNSLEPSRNIQEETQEEIKGSQAEETDEQYRARIARMRGVPAAAPTLQDRAAAARAGVAAAPTTMQDRLAESRQAEARREQREAEREARRSTLYTEEETAAPAAEPVIATLNDAGATVAYVAPTPPAQTEVEPAAEAGTAIRNAEAAAAPTPELHTIAGVYKFGQKQNVRIRDISNSNEFRGPRRVTKEAVKFLRKNKEQQEVLLFRHPDGKIYVLDGKAAIEAQKLNRRATVPARFFNGTVEEAREVAHMRKPAPPQTLLSMRSSRVLMNEPRNFEEYTLQFVLGLMNKVGEKPALSLADFVRYSGFVGVQQNRLRMNYGRTVGEGDIKDLRSRGVLSNNKRRRIIPFDIFVQGWLNRTEEETEDAQDLTNTLTDLLLNYQSPEKIIEYLETAQGLTGAPLTENLLPFNITPEEATFIAEQDLSATLTNIIHNVDDGLLSDDERIAYNNLIRGHTAADGTMDTGGMFNEMVESGDEDVISLRDKLARYATKQARETQSERLGNTGRQVVLETSDGRKIESDEDGNFFSRWTGPSATDQAVITRAAKRIVAVLKKPFAGLETTFDREAFQNQLQTTIGAQNSRLGERAVYLHDKLNEAQNELKNAQAALLSKRQQLDRSIKADQVDLFGNRASAATQGMFDERVDKAAREKAIKPYQDRVTNAKKRVGDLSAQLADAVKQGVQQQTMFSKEVADAPAVGLRSGAEKVGYNYDTQKVARERFDIPNLKQLSAGSDRAVFQLSDGKVLKIAKTARGLEQNIHEGSWDLVQEGIIPEVYERGLNYIVAEAVEPAKDRGAVLVQKEDGTYALQSTTNGYRNGELKGAYKTKAEAQAALDKKYTPGQQALNQLLFDIADFSQTDFRRRTPALQEALEKHGMEYILNYDDILFGDFQRGANWGIKDDKPIHLDGGTFGGVAMIEKYMRKSNMDDADFRRVYYESKGLKKEYGDTDKYTMFSRGGQVLGIVSKGKVFFNPDAVRMDTPMHEIGGHILTAWAKENQPELYAKILASAATAPDSVKAMVRQNYPEYAEESPLFAEEVFATALGLDEKNQKIAEQLAADPGGWRKLKAAVMDVWNDFINFLIDKGIVRAGTTFSPQEFQDMTFADFAALVGQKLSQGRRLSAPQAVAVNSENALLDLKDYEVDKWGNPTRVRPGVQAEIATEKAAIKAAAIADGTYLKAPNGQVSLLSEDRWLTVRTERFRRWAGDSVLKSSNGEPKVFYHGTNTDIKVFNDEQGVWFTPDRATANQYAALGTRFRGGTENVVAVFLRGKVLDAFGGTEAEYEQWLRIGDNADAIREAGYDGWNDGRGIQMFRAGDVKSAVYNSTFSEDTEDIRFQKQATTEEQLVRLFAAPSAAVPDQIKLYGAMLQTAIENGTENEMLRDTISRLGLQPSTQQQQWIDAIDKMSGAQKAVALNAVDETQKEVNPTWQSVFRRYRDGMQTIAQVPPAAQEKPRVRIRLKPNGALEEVPVSAREEKGTERLDDLTRSIPNEGKLSQYMSGATITTAYGEGPQNPQDITIQELNKALAHGENMIEKAREIWGPNFATPFMGYIDAFSGSPAVKSLMYVSLENHLAIEKKANPDRAAEITKVQTALYTKSQAFAREVSKGLNFWRLRNIAMRGYDTRITTDAIFTPTEVEQRNNLETAVQADADAVNKEADAGPIETTAAEAEAIETEKAAVAAKPKPVRKKVDKKSFKPQPNAAQALKDKLAKLREDIKNIQC